MKTDMPFIWQMSILNFAESAIIQGVVLCGRPPDQKKSTTLNTFAGVIGSYLKKTYANREIVVSIDEMLHPVITDDNSGFLLELDKPFNGSFKIFPKGSSRPFNVVQSYPIVFNDTDFPLAIISDIDDTILVSHTLSFLKRVSALLFISPHKRKPISFTQEILKQLSTQSGRVFYVSKSESNLFAILTRFIVSSGLPKGLLMLTPYLRFKRLIGLKKAKDFKERTIRLIINHSPDKMFILMGDDTQLDISVYTEIVKSYPRQIFKVYIRKTRKNILGNKQEQLNKLMDLGVPVLYFTDISDPAKEMNSIKNHKNPRA